MPPSPIKLDSTDTEQPVQVSQAQTQTHQNEPNPNPDPPTATQPPKRRCQLEPHERVKLVLLKEIGWSYGEIQERYPHIPLGTIKTTIGRAAKRGPTQETLVRRGAPKKLDEADQVKLFKAVEENPGITNPELLALIDYKISRGTLWKMLREHAAKKGKGNKRK